jgi:hypothetical protein
MTMMTNLSYLLFAVLWLSHHAVALNVVIPGGSGKLGKVLIPKLMNHEVTVLSRNGFLASAPNRVTEDFGHLGVPFLERNPHARIRDWDGGDLLDIVGQDWVGWQDDTLKSADVIINLVGGYTEQRTMATERLVRESYRVNPAALQITVTPTEEDIPSLTPGMVTLKKKRLKQCEDMVKNNCQNSLCLRLEAYRVEEACEEILKAVEGWQGKN